LADGRILLVSASGDKTVRLWDPATGQQIGKPSPAMPAGCGSVCVRLADGRILLVSTSDDKTVRLWERTIGQQMDQLSSLVGARDRCAFSDYCHTPGRLARARPPGRAQQAGELTVFDDVPAEPAPGPRAGPDELARDGVDDRDLTPWAG
jgi:hypothetical protein